MTKHCDGAIGRVAVVTGSAMGIGEAIAARLALDGLTVVVADISEDAAYLACERIDKYVRRAETYRDALKLQVCTVASDK